MSEVIIALLYTFLSLLQAHQKHVEYLNKKIDFYDELTIVVGKDTATSSFSKSYVDLENEPDNGDSAEFCCGQCGGRCG